MDLNFRVATEADVWPLMALYQKVGSTFTRDTLFLEYESLRNAILSDSGVWLIGEYGSAITTVISLFIDNKQGLSKIGRIMVNPEIKSLREDLRHTIRQCIKHLEQFFPEVDVLYCSTMTVPRQLQETTLEEGFKILGIFPNALGADSSRLNGLTAYYLRDTLQAKRVSNFFLHPKIIPFFEISRKQLGLPALLPAILKPSVPDPTLETVSLEIVSAPNLVKTRFDKLKSKRKQMTNFYPFHSPNLLFTDPEEEIQIFVRHFESTRFATILAEDLLAPVDPVQLYTNVLQLLRSLNVSYVEIINDAADTVGNQWIIDANFVPCCYIPAFKRQNESRRDYVVFCRTYEYICRPDLNDTHKPFLDFFREFFNMEWKNYVG